MVFAFQHKGTALLSAWFVQNALLVAYGAVVVGIFFILRAVKSTWQVPAGAPNPVPGFGQPLTLLQAGGQFLRCLCPQVLLPATLAAVAVRIYLGQWLVWDVVVACGVLISWPFQEWFVHVFLLHFKPRRILGITFEPVVCQTHRMHHQNPWDPRTGLAAPHILALYVLGLPLIWSLTIPLPQACTGVVVSVLLVLNYEWIHYLIHTSYKPRSWLYKRLWRNHRLHHFKNEGYWYGVTTLLGDQVCGTRPPPETTVRSSNCLNLNGGDDLPLGDDSQHDDAQPVTRN